MVSRQKNDDTLTKLGDIFHYLIVLEHCLNLSDGETIVVEMYGDISKISENDSLNAEIKHHNSKHNLGDRNTDFWKTLKNWLDNKDKMKEFKNLILITTSNINDGSSFKNWNYINKDERFSLIKEIGSTIKDSEETFRKHYSSVFLNSESDIKELLEKVIFYFGEMKIEDKYSSLTKDRVFMGLEQDNILPFINELMGYIITKPISSPHKWIITYDDFRSHFLEINKRFSTSTRPIPDSFATKEPQNINAYFKEKFSKEIYKIDYGKDEVREAIINHWRTKQTAIHYFHNNPIYLMDFNLYKDELESILKIKKRTFKRECDISNKKECINKSQDLFDKSLLLDARSFGSINPNRLFFQHGTIHEIVNEREFSWLIEDEKK